MAKDQYNPIACGAPDHALGQYQAWRAPAADASALAGGEQPLTHRLLPHGEPSIAIVRRRDRHGAICELDLEICGPYYQGKHYAPAAREELIAWRVKPELAAALYGVAPADYSDFPRITAPKNLHDACARTLSLSENASARQVLKSLHRDLFLFASDKAPRSGPEIFAAQQLRDSNGQMRLRDIAARLNVSERHLRRRFADHTGCSPKTYARFLQITAAALAAEKSPAPDWAEIAAEAGFHDQPHMINTFQLEIGMTPKAFHAERQGLL